MLCLRREIQELSRVGFYTFIRTQRRETCRRRVVWWKDSSPDCERANWMVVVWYFTMVYSQGRRKKS